MVAIPEWLMWVWILLFSIGIPTAYRIGRTQAWKEFRAPAKKFYDWKEDGL